MHTSPTSARSSPPHSSQTHDYSLAEALGIRHIPKTWTLPMARAFCVQVGIPVPQEGTHWLVFEEWLRDPRFVAAWRTLVHLTDRHVFGSVLDESHLIDVHLLLCPATCHPSYQSLILKQELVELKRRCPSGQWLLTPTERLIILGTIYHMDRAAFSGMWGIVCAVLATAHARSEREFALVASEMGAPYADLNRTVLTINWSDMEPTRENPFTLDTNLKTQQNPQKGEHINVF